MKYFFFALYFLLCISSFLGFIAPYSHVTLLPLVQFLPITWWICLILHTLSIPFFCTKTRYKQLYLPLIGILMALWIGHKEVRFSEKADIIPAKSIKVLTWNIENFRFDKQIIDDVILFIKKEKPDIVCFQEFRLDLIHTKEGERFTHHTEAYISKALDLPYYSFTAFRTHIVGTAYFSRFPLAKMDTCFIDERETNSGILMTFQTPQGKLGVANLHLKSYNVGQVMKKADTWKEKFWAFVRKSSEVLTIQEILAKKSNQKFQEYASPLVVVGDMNAVPHTRSIHLLSAGLKDGFLEKGQGWHTTFPIYKKWGLRIDYQFHNDKIKLCSYKVLHPKAGFSDHLPLVAVYEM
jgi:endonuclease/exonuclease/phosphatase family metal-dependent hydrolase